MQDGLSEPRSHCEKCPLVDSCDQRVSSPVITHADLMVIGDHPSKEDELYGRPFVSREGVLLDRLLSSSGFDLAKTYKTYAVKCVPKKTVSKKAIKACQRWLREEVAAANPRSIVCLGKTAEASLLTFPFLWEPLVVGGLAKVSYGPIPVYFWKSIRSLLLAGKRADEETINFLTEVRLGKPA